MRPHKTITPIQKAFLNYVLEYKSYQISSGMNDQLESVLKTGEYLTDGPRSMTLNIFRRRYERDFWNFRT